jgi:hypothetical protein
MLRWCLKQYLVQHALRVNRSQLDPHWAQQIAFRRLSALLRGSELSALAAFDRCRLLEDCRRLPISDEVSLKPQFDRAFTGGPSEGAIFGRSRIRSFGRTSGTGDAPKHIPLNQAYLNSLDRTLVRMVGSHYFTTGAWASLLRGKQVLLGSRPLVGVSPTRLPVADISGLIPTRSWRTLRWLYFPKHRDLWLQTWNERVEATLAQSHKQDVVSISGIPALAMDFERRALEKFGVRSLSELWPNLRLYLYGAVSLSSEQKEGISKRWLGGERRLGFAETYFATEAQLAFSFDPREEGMVLNSLENLYLFQQQGEGSSLLFAHELAQGQTYSVFVTTPGGLIQYRMGDRAEVLSTRPLRIRVVGREKEEISLTGEKITLDQLDRALRTAGVRAGISESRWPIVWVEQGVRPRLVWAFPQSMRPLLTDSLKTRLDDALCEVNSLYLEALRYEEVIGGCRLITLPDSLYEAYLAASLENGQFKPKRIFSSAQEFSQAYGHSLSIAEPE